MERQLRSDLHTPRQPEALVTPDAPRDQIDVVLYGSPLLCIGRWRCPAQHPQFRDSGPASDTLFVFPRESVWIQHAGGEPFVADMNTVTYYNAGQEYRRRRLSEWGDRCEWFAFPPAVVAEALAVHEPAAADRPHWPFAFSHGPADAESYLQQRLVFEHVLRERNTDSLYVEETMLNVLGRVSRRAYQCRGSLRRAGPRGRNARDVVEAARQIIAQQFQRSLSLARIATEVGVSVFHLSRLFHARTGFALHQYRNQLRLRMAMERLTSRTTELTQLGLELGFSSHSHFTESFRRTFGRTPSSFRRDTCR